MTDEQKKVRKFYKDFLSWKAESIGTWIGAGFLVMLMLVSCAVPVQEVLAEIETDTESAVALMVMLVLFGPLAGVLYLRPYEGYMENQKGVTILSKLKYLPVDFKEIRKMKMIYLVKFFAKILPFCMILQAATSIYSYGEISWMNVAYVLLTAFVWPIAINLLSILIER